MLKLTTPQEMGGRGHPSLLKSPNWGPYELLRWLPSTASSGDSRPSTDLLCDLGQVIPLLRASLSLSFKRWGWTAGLWGPCKAWPCGAAEGLDPERGQTSGLTSSVKTDEGSKKVSLTKPTFDRVNIPASLSGGGWKNPRPRTRSWPGKGFSGTSFPALRLASFTGQDISEATHPLSMFTCHTHAPACISPHQGQMEVRRQIQKKP